MERILFCLALMLGAQTTHASTLAELNGAQFGLNQASPNMMQKHRLGTKLVKQALHSVKVTYNFATQGGAISTIKLTDSDTGLAATLPKSAIVRDCVIDVITAPVGSSATIALSTGKSAGDLLGTTAITSYGVGLHACIPVGTAATSLKLTADVTPTALIATTALTAGKFNVIIDYSLSE